MPNCTGKNCGDDGCGGSCGACTDPQTCSDKGTCETTQSDPPHQDPPACVPTCGKHECGDNGCNGSCGECQSGYECKYGYCEEIIHCTPDCTNQTCGDDGCGGSCGACGNNEVCASGACCKPDCNGKTCGDDGCGGICGECTGADRCNEAGACEPWVVSGTVYYEKQNFTISDTTHEAKAGSVETLPANDVPVFITDKNAKRVKGYAFTDENGKYAITATEPLLSTDQLSIIPAWIDKGIPRIIMQRSAATYPLPVWNFSGTLSNLSTDGALTQLKDATLTVDKGSGVFNILNTIRTAHKHLLDMNVIETLDDLDPIAVAWAPDMYWTCGSCYFTNNANQVTSVQLELSNVVFPAFFAIDGMNVNQTAWNTHSILHDFGHFFLTTRRSSEISVLHNVYEALAPNLAWVEGWAEFYALVEESYQASQMLTTAWNQTGYDLNTIRTWVDYTNLEQGVDASFYEKYTDPATNEPKTRHIVGYVPVLMPSKDASDGIKQKLSSAWVTWFLLSIWNGSDYDQNGALTSDFKLSFQKLMNNVLSSPRYVSIQDYNYANDDLKATRTAYGVDLVDFIDALICTESVEKDKLLSFISTQTGFPYDNSPVCIPKDAKEASAD